MCFVLVNRGKSFSFPLYIGAGKSLPDSLIGVRVNSFVFVSGVWHVPCTIGKCKPSNPRENGRNGVTDTREERWRSDRSQALDGLRAITRRVAGSRQACESLQKNW